MTTPRSTPRVAVITPMHNATPTLDATVQSVLAQSLTDWRLYLVDDASTDDTRAQANTWTQRDPRITLLSTSVINGGRPAGPGAARNLAIDASTSEYLWFLDADDWLAPSALESLTRHADTTPHRASFASHTRVDPEGVDLYWPSAHALSSVGLNDLLDENRIPILSHIIARSTLAELRFDANLPAVEDWDLWLRLALRGVTWSRLDECVATYRQGRATRSNRFTAVAQAAEQTLTRAFASARGDPRWSLLDLTEQRLRRALAAGALTAAAPAALSDPALAASLCSRLPLTPEAAARAALWLLPTAEGQGPSAWRDEHHFARFASASTAWWSALGQDFASRATAHLASLLVPTEQIIARIIDHIPLQTPIILFGLGANGCALAQNLQSCAISFTVRDHAFTPPASRERPKLSRPIAIESIAAPIPADALCILTPLNDAALCGSLPTSARILRWSHIREELAEHWLDRLHRATESCAAPAKGAA